MEIRHLRYFVAVAQELHFGRAAARLHMATSPLSRRIQDLERELGVELFLRRHHQVRLTPAGEKLLPEAVELLDRFAALPAVVGAGLRYAEVGIAPDVSPTVRGALLAALRARHPEVEVRLRPASTGPLVHAVVEGDLDLALVHGPVDDQRLAVEVLGSNTVRVAVGAGFEDRESVTLGELAHLAYASIAHTAAPLLYGRTDRMLTRAGITRRMTLDGPDFAGLAHLVASGQAFTFVSEGTGATFKAFVGEPVTLLPVTDMPARMSTLAVWRHDHGDWDVGRLVADAIEITGRTEESTPR